MTNPSLDVAQVCITTCLQLISEGKNEQVIRDSFTSYLRQMFPDAPSWVEHHIRGGESAVKLNKGQRETTGFVDNLVDLTAIEYEADLSIPAKFQTGYGQVRDYCASLINTGNNPDLVIGVLSDTVRWYAYRVEPIPQKSSPLTGQDIQLTELERIDTRAADGQAALRLISFLERHLGRLGARPLTAHAIAQDLGFESPFGQERVTDLAAVVDAAFDGNKGYAELIVKLWSNFVNSLEPPTTHATFDRQPYVDELYLLTLGKLICANVISRKALISDDPELETILNGDFFFQRGLENLVEYDYFGWIQAPPYLSSVLPVARAMQRDLQAYDFDSTLADDIFGQIMAQLAGRAQGLLLGQEWTPSWLCKQIVSHVLSNLPAEQAPRLVDMCCGSGAMVVETIKHVKARYAQSGGDEAPEERISHLAQAITGFDIDPLAVILAKVNWVVAARDWLEPFGAYRVSIPIYHADSLFALMPLSQASDDDEAETIPLRIADRSLQLPRFLLAPAYQGLFDALINRAYDTIRAAAPSPQLEFDDALAEVMIEDLLTSNPAPLTDKQRPQVDEFLKSLIVELDLLDRAGRNGIWAFILRNSYRPGLVAGQFNGLVSNPPWLALSKIANNPYQIALKKKAEAYAITPPGASHLHVELATIFLLHAVDRYLAPEAAFGCILPETVLNGYHHHPFRAGAYLSAPVSVDLSIEQLWRVQEGTFKNNAVVLFGHRLASKPGKPDPIPGAIAGQTGLQPAKFHRVTQGQRTAWTEKAPAPGAAPTGFFKPANFKQGADIMPRTLFFFEVQPAPSVGSRKQVILKSIDPITSAIAFAVKDAKKHADFQITPTVVPEDLIFDVVTSNLLTPFDLADFNKALLPIKKVQSTWQPLTALEVTAKGGAVQRLFQQIATTQGATANVSTLWNLLDIRNKLSQQVIPSNGYLVLTGAGGGRVCSTFLELSPQLASKLVIDQTAYWAPVDNYDEAVYLTGLFNSEAINLVIKEFQPKGAFGERHVHTLPFGATPPYDPSHPAHHEVVSRTKDLLNDYAAARKSTGVAPHLNPNQGSLARRRSAIQEQLKKLPSYAAYDQACRALYDV